MTTHITRADLPHITRLLGDVFKTLQEVRIAADERSAALRVIIHPVRELRKEDIS